MVSPGESLAKAAQTCPFSKTAALEPLSSFSKAAAPSGFVPSINAKAAATSGSASRALESHSSAASTAFAEAVCESGVALSDATFVRLRGALLSRMSSATPHLLTSGRTTCPSCNGELCQTSFNPKRHPQASCWIFAEPVAFQITHVPRWCTPEQCKVTCSWKDKEGNACEAKRTIRYGCGFFEERVRGDLRTYTKKIGTEFLHENFWLLNKSFGISLQWLRRWRYRLLVHRASSMGEGTISHLMHGLKYCKTSPGGCQNLGSVTSCGDAPKTQRPKCESSSAKYCSLSLWRISSPRFGIGTHP